MGTTRLESYFIAYLLLLVSFLPSFFKSLWRGRTLCVRSSYMLYGLLSIFVHINGLNQ